MSANGSVIALARERRPSTNTRMQLLVCSWDASLQNWTKSVILNDCCLQHVRLSLSDNGSTLAAGMPCYEDHCQGRSRVYRHNSSSSRWTQLGNDLRGIQRFGLSGEAIALTADGSRVAIASPYHSTLEAYEAGHVRVFEYDETQNWRQVGGNVKGRILGGNTFGRSLAMSASGDHVAIGSNGTVYVFEKMKTTAHGLGADVRFPVPPEHHGNARLQ